ncbi:hypothetical protein COB11_06685 [Candidatus Aerophobetes bacterium]|uniref:Porin n=1 Tax=Aerophobetes bacterium TaxID=2030807 RepID=A0A2A4YDF9_UNCAE|nr:MAG: hypothetical protein COB11_06685 [Candidatus Aerophobetes bacterium]
MFKRYIFSFLLFGTIALNAIDSPIVQPRPTDSFTEEEIKDLKEWIKKKKLVVGIKSFGGELTFSGELHAGMTQSNEVLNGVKQRGSGGAFPSMGTRSYDVEMDLLMNYRAEITWATAKIKFKNKAGIASGSGTSNRVSLDRAFMGVRFLQGESWTMDLEIGRRKLSYTFDSQIEFGSFMDGILLKYDHTFDSIGDVYFHGGPFVVDFTVDHYAYIFEIGFLNIGNTGIYTKYAFLDWDTKNYGNRQKDDQYRFLTNQVTLGYKVVPKWMGKVLTIYAAGLVNSAARELPVTANKKANWAWYAGFFLGEARKKGDWSVNANYQYVMPQAVPGFDSIGIGRGNAAGTGLYCANSSCSIPTTRRTAAGNTNYKGFNLQLLYLFTNNLTLKQGYKQSIRQDKAVGPIFRYKAYNLELVYIF